MTTPDEAIKAIREMDFATAQLTGAIHNNRGTKVHEVKLKTAASKLFKLLTGVKPSSEQLLAMLNW